MFSSREVLKKVHFLAKSLSHFLGQMEEEGILKKWSLKVKKKKDCTNCHRAWAFTDQLFLLLLTCIHYIRNSNSIRADVHEVYISLFIKAVKNHREIRRV